MNFSVITGFAAFILYLTACLILYRQFRGKTVPSRASILIPGTLAVIAHGASLWQVMITDEGLQLGLFPIASATAVTGAAVVLTSSLYRPFEWISALVYPFAAATIPAMLWVNTGYTAHPLTHGLGAHVL
ncbi:MAG: ABC-type uncharacterized transport system permease subunit, partial [Alcanivorax borkumensis]